MKKTILISGIVGFSLIISVGIFFFSGDNFSNQDGSFLQNALANAQAKLAFEKNKLDGMVADLKQSFSLAVAVQDQMRQATAIVNKTNFMFKDATGADPRLIVKNPLPNILINDQRRGINSFLAMWQSKSGLSGLKLLDISASEQIRKNAEDIQTYLNGLTQIVDKLTPENSGLSQFQIDNYSAQLPSVDQIKQVISSIDSAIQNAKKDGYVPPDPQSGTPVVSGEDIAAQQAIVDAAQKAADALKAQLDQQNKQNPPQPDNTNQDQTPPVPDNTPADNSTPPAPDTSGTNPPTQADNNTINYGVHRTIDKNQGIIVQPGPMQLIPGTDPY